jgi:CubicO group peptidase (beta-lactamase class C family)
LVCAARSTAGVESEPPRSTAGADPRVLGTAGYAKIVCSAVFVSGRDAAEARRNSTYFVVSDEDRAAVTAVDVDRFDRIGIRRMVLETDPYGHFLLNGYDYGTARNWARLGLLYLQGGRWRGEQILPDGWSTFVSTPAPAWKRPVYGAFVWLNHAGQLRLPVDAYFMLGAGGQYTIVVPSRELVVVRMGHQRGSPRAEDTLNDALEGIAAALPRRGAP